MCIYFWPNPIPQPEQMYFMDDPFYISHSQKQIDTCIHMMKIMLAKINTCKDLLQGGGHSYMMYDMQIYAFKYLQEKGVKIEAMHG